MAQLSFRSRAHRRLVAETVARSRRLPVRKNTVLYEANSGRGAVCNPEAIFRALMAAPDMSHLKHLWVLEEDCLNDPIVAEFEKAKNVRFIEYKSLEYYYALGTAGYLVNNSTFPPELSKRPEQTYINTWHGTPLKRMGYDVEGGGPDTRNIIKNFLAADWILSPNPFTTETMLRKGYRLDGIFRGKIAEVGYPRVDHQFQGPLGRKQTLERLRASGTVVPAGAKIALYAPTWKGASFYDPLDEMASTAEFVTELQERLGPGWRVLLKVHQRVLAQTDARPELRDRLVPNHIPANTALAVSDALITDYSSIFYDYQALERPILFYIPDYDSYSGYRGLYQEPADWPGPIVTTVEAAAEALLAAPDEAVTDRLRAARQTYNPHDDGRASQRVVDLVFRGKDTGGTVISDFSDGRTSLLLYPGGLLPNGITSSCVNMLNSLDFDRFDVSVAYGHSTKPDALSFLSRIDPRIRLLPRIGRFTTGKKPLEQVLGAEFPWGDDARAPRARKDFHDEWRRCFGDARFDHVIDFSGYGPLWAGIFAAAPSGVKSIWQHNDMVSEVSKEINDSTPHERRLKQVFDLYNDFDTVVAVSPSLCELNRAGLQHYAPHTAFTYARNLIDGEAALARARPRFELQRPQAEAPQGADLRTQVRLLTDAYGGEAVAQAVEFETVLSTFLPPSEDTTFLTIGRMSPEKNQARMIRAFAQVHRENPATRLVMVGDGVLRESLRSLVQSLGLGDAVALTGQVSNPFPLYEAADCFVLSSDYEGQPMVILEARVLDLPIVSTRFASVTDALSDDQGLIVDRSDDALAEGMRAYLAGAVPQQAFDWKAYNAQALGEFLSAVRAA